MKSKSPLDIDRTVRRSSINPSSNSTLRTSTTRTSNSRIPFNTKTTLISNTRIACFPSNQFPKPPLHLYRTSTPNLTKQPLYTGKIQNYTTGKILGQGAYSIVKQAICRTSKEIYAIKTYQKSSLINPQKKKNLVRQIRVLKKINHQNIIFIKQAIDSPRQIHIVTEYIQGLSLDTYLKKSPNLHLSEIQTRRIFSQIVKAIAYCHNRSIAHRDIKLQNILLDQKSNVKIIDFGFSTCIPNQRAVRLFCGTPNYMAPQIINRKQFTGPPADIWALGVLFFVMLTGKFPIEAGNNRELYRKIQRGIFEVPQWVNGEARLMIKKMMEVDPKKRLTAEQILNEPWMKGGLNGFECQRKVSLDVFREIDVQGRLEEDSSRRSRRLDLNIGCL